MSSNGSAPTIVEHLRGGMQNLIANAVAAEAKRHAYDVLDDEVLGALAKAIVPFVREVVAEALAPLAARNAALEARLIQLEQQPSMKYCGVWEPERTYFIGDFVTQDGSTWHCERSCMGVRPPASTWTLAVKRGRDAKGAK
jgi:hypothetical protein